MNIEVKENEKVIEIIERAVKKEVESRGLLGFLREIAESEAHKEVKRILMEYNKIESLRKSIYSINGKITYMTTLYKKINAEGIKSQIDDTFHTWQSKHTSFETRLRNFEIRLKKLEVKKC